MKRLIMLLAGVLGMAAAQDAPVRWDSVLTHELKGAGSRLANYAETPLTGANLNTLLKAASTQILRAGLPTKYNVTAATLYYPVVLWASCAGGAWNSQTALAALRRDLKAAGYTPLTPTTANNVDVWRARNAALPLVATSVETQGCQAGGAVTAVLYQVADENGRKPHTRRR